MGRSHALSGAVGWLAGCAALHAAGGTLDTSSVWAGAAVSAGFALLPDVDHPGSTVSRTLGPLTGAASWVVVRLARVAQRGSCGHCRRDPAAGGHRGLTHTAAGAAATGLVSTLAVWAWGRPATLLLVGFGVWLLAHTALSARTRAKVGDWLLPGRFRYKGKAAFRACMLTGSLLIGVAGAAVVSGGVPAAGWRWLGVAVGWGCLAHTLGDAMTYSRVPLLWPVRIGGCRWQRVGVPAWMRFRTGSRTETAVVMLMAACGVVAVGVLHAG